MSQKLFITSSQLLVRLKHIKWRFISVYMRFLVASEDSGNIKEVVVNRSTETLVGGVLQPLYMQAHLGKGILKHVQKMTMLDKSRMIIARSNGSIELIMLKLVDMNNEGDLTPKFQINEFKTVDILELFDESNQKHVSNPPKKYSKIVDEFVEVYLVPDIKDTCVVASKSGRVHFIEVRDEKLKVKASHEVKGPVEFFQLNDIESSYERYIFAYGGEDNLIKLAEVQKNLCSCKQIWASKNVANDRLDLKVPIWPMAAKFLKSCEGVERGKLNYQLLSISRHGHLRFYQTSHGRKPVSSLDMERTQGPLVKMELLGCVTPLGNAKSCRVEDVTIVTADTKRGVFRFSHRAQLLGKFGSEDITGSAGVLNIYQQKYLLQGGLDRYLRVFDIKSGQLLVKVFIDSKIKAITLLDDRDVDLAENKSSIKKRSQQEHEEPDDLWNELDIRNKKRNV